MKILTALVLTLFIVFPVFLFISFQLSRKCLNGDTEQGVRLLYCNAAIASTAPFVGNMKRSALFMERGIIYSNDLARQNSARDDFHTALIYAESGPKITGSTTPSGVKVWTQRLIDRIASEDPTSRAVGNWKSVAAMHGHAY